MIFTGFFKQLKGFLLPIVFTLGLRLRMEDGIFENRTSLYFVLGFLGLSLLTGFLRWFFFTYDYQDQVLHIRSGIFVKKERFIKKERVQTVNYKANVFYRFLNLVTLQIETAGGFKEPEIDIEAIDRKKATLLRDALKQEAEPGEPQSESESVESESVKSESAGFDDVSKPVKDEHGKDEHGKDAPEKRQKEKPAVYTVGYTRLALAGMTSSGIGVIFSFIAVVFGQGVALIPDEWLNRFLRIFQNTGVTVIISLVFIAFLIAWLISILRFIFAYGEFRIEKGEKEILIRRGLLEQKELSIKTHRIQGIRMIEGLLRQPFGYATLQVEVAGGASQDDGFKTTIHPLIHRKELQEFLRLIAPERVYREEFRPLPKRSLKRYLFRSMVFLLPLPVAFYFIPGNLVWLGMLIFPFSALFGYLRYNDAGYRIEGDHLLLRYRVFSRTTVLLKRQQIQSLQTQTNLLQKLRNLTSVNATILSAMMKADFTVKDLDVSEAQDIWQWYRRR